MTDLFETITKADERTVPWPFPSDRKRAERALLEAELNRELAPITKGRIDAEIASIEAEKQEVRLAEVGTPICNANILAIDPGTTETGWVVYDGRRVVDSGVSANREVLDRVAAFTGPLAIEMIASYGMAVGREVFETCVWIGRMVQAYRDPNAVKLIYRRDVKLHLCGSAKAKDPNIRQALLDMFPATGGGKTPQVGTKNQPGPLYGVTSHVWSALAVAITALDQRTVSQEA